MIDYNMLATILSSAIIVILLGGLITGYDTAVLIPIGVIGFGCVILFRRLGRDGKGADASKGKGSKSKKRK